MNPATVNSEVSNAQNQGNALQSQYNTQANQQYGAYQGAQNQSNAAYQNLQNYNNTLQGSGNPLTMYNNQLQSAFNTQGFNPQSLQTATQNLTQSQNALGNLSQAAQSGTGGYGLTGGQLGNYYSTLTQPLQQQVGAQNNAVQNEQQLYQNATNQAQQATNLGFQGEQQVSQNYQSLYQNSVQQMQTAGQTLNQLQTLQQQQGQLTANQVAAYQNAYSSYVGAQAASEQAAAAMKTATATSAQTNQQVAMMNQVQQKYGLGGIANSMGVPSSVTNPKAPAQQSQAQQLAAKTPSNWFSVGNILNTLSHPSSF